jgi:glyoxylase-like metal-dependent hydrolase (beta-lactamase superfamily II)
MKIWSVESNRQMLDGGAMFGNAPKALWSRWIEPDEIGRIPLACRCFLLELEGKIVLLEAGIGAFFEPKLADRFGVQSPGTHQLLENLEALGFKEQDIDIVILSHLHFDHAGGLLPTYQEIQDSGERLLFPNATYVVGHSAWDRALNPHFRDKASFVPALNHLLQNCGRLQLVNPETDTLLGNKIRFVTSSGHTPGQIHTVVSGNSGAKAFLQETLYQVGTGSTSPSQWVTIATPRN